MSVYATSPFCCFIGYFPREGGEINIYIPEKDIDITVLFDIE